MNKQEFMEEVRNQFSPDVEATPQEVAEFVWNRWLGLYAYSMPTNPGKAWGQQW